MPDERREFHKIRPASHTLLSVNCLYQMNMEKRKGVFTKLGRGRDYSSTRQTAPSFMPRTSTDFVKDKNQQFSLFCNPP
jgi:hypothetical protein